MKLEDLAEISSGQGAPQEESAFSDDGYPFIRAGNLESLLVSNDEYASCKLINPVTAQKYKLYLFPRNTIVFAKSGMSATKGRIYSLMNDSYIVNHLATVLPNPKLLHHSYLKYFLIFFSPSRLIKDSAYPSISLTDVKQIQIPLPPIEEQHRIVKILDLAQSLIEKRKQAISYLDDYIKAVFLDMFGDPVSNPKGWEKKQLSELGTVITGNTPPRDNPTNYSPRFIEWIKTDNIVLEETFVTRATEYLSESGLSKARFVNPNSILVACIAGSIESIGRAGITDRKVSFNQQINAIEPNPDMNARFFYWLLKMSKVYIQNHATNGMKRILTKGEFQKVKFIKPSYETQIKFSLIVNRTELLKQKMQTQLKELENNFGAQLQRAFKQE